MLSFYTVVYSERDNFEAELKELKRRFETLDLSHTALTRERVTLSKEVLHTHLHTLPLCFVFTMQVENSVLFIFLSSRW